MSPGPRRFAAPPALALALALALIGPACGQAVVDPIQVALGCPEQPLRGADTMAGEPTDRLLDDFEDGDSSVSLVAGRDGTWVVGDDGTSRMVGWENSERCAVRGTRAGHFFGTGFTSWGANFTGLARQAVGMRATPYDARAYGGLSFWGAIDNSGTASMEVPVGVTTVDTAWNGGVCTTCMDYHRTTVTLTADWRLFKIRFADLKQAGFGVPPAALHSDQLVGFIIWPTMPFGIWIDDVRLEP